MYFEINKKFDNIIFRLITKPDNRDINYDPRLKSLF
jgi:hypothetical protein